jgi:hypothetical protein
MHRYRIDRDFLFNTRKKIPPPGFFLALNCFVPQELLNINSSLVSESCNNIVPCHFNQQVSPSNRLV